MIDLSTRPDPECLSFDQLVEECHALRRMIGEANTSSRAPAVDPIALAPIQARLFLALAQRPGTIVSPCDLFAALYGDPLHRPRANAPAPGVVTVHLHHLRAKLAGTGLSISNAWGRGYRLDGEPDLVRRTALAISAGREPAPA